jgi:PAS domain S-box-containing protein
MPTDHDPKDQIPALSDPQVASREAAAADAGDALPEAGSTLLLAIINNTQNIIYVKGLDGRYLLVNRSFGELTGFRASQVLGKTPFDIFPPEIAHQHIANDQRIAASRSPSSFTEQAQLADGRHTFLSVKFPIFDAAGMLTAIGGISTDITERVRTEERLRLSEERFRLAFHTSPDSINLNRLEDGMFVDINEGFTNLTGYSREDVLGRTSLEIQIWQDPEDRKRLVAGLQAAGRVQNLEARFVRKSGAVGVGLMSASLLRIEGGVYILSVTRDITELKEIEKEKKTYQQQLVQAQKLEAVGLLAGGVAHDFNNLLQVINGHADIAAALLDGEPQGVRRHLGEISRAGARASTLVEQLLAFSRRQVMHPQDLDLNAIVSEFLGMIRRMIGAHIRLDFIPGNDLGTVHVDRNIIERVLANLCVNARDAMPDGGTLSIATRNVSLAPDGERPPTGDAGRHVLLIVADSGIGMPPETIAHAFEPFFTTKAPGRGTGLGLATVYGNIQQLGGAVAIESQPGHGTTVRVYLPAVQRPAAAADPKLPEAVGGGGETVLLAEDNAEVRRVAAEFLERAGYGVIAVAHGREAIDAFRESEGHVDLLLFDVVMPVMGGREAFERIRALRPGIPVLFASGYSENAVHTNFVIDRDLHLIQKPFTRQELLRAVRRVLDAGTPPPPAG